MQYPYKFHLYYVFACLQMVKAWGAHVTVTCSQNAERLVRDLGADDVVDYTAGPVEKHYRHYKSLFLGQPVCDFFSWTCDLNQM